MLKHKVHRAGVGVILSGVALWAGTAAASPVPLSQLVVLEPVDNSRYVATDLREEQRLVNECRYRPEADLDVYADSTLKQRLLTLRTPNTQVILTGVTGAGVAQIKDPALGWVSTDHLESCAITTTTTTTTTTTRMVAPAPSASTGSSSGSSSSAPSSSAPSYPSSTPSSNAASAPPTATESETACYRNLTNLTVRTGADDRYSQLGVYRSGATIYAADRPPQEQTASDGRVWVRINAPNGDGWVARTGPNGSGSNLVRLADDQCDR